VSSTFEMGLVLIIGNLRSYLFPTQHPLVKAYPAGNMGQTSPNRRGVACNGLDYRRIILEPILPYGRN
jgi:hypothetical protein